VLLTAQRWLCRLCGKEGIGSRKGSVHTGTAGREWTRLCIEQLSASGCMHHHGSMARVQWTVAEIWV
jgi:hypothetical protein